jgi:subtilisin family serine protease
MMDPCVGAMGQAQTQRAQPQPTNTANAPGAAQIATLPPDPVHKLIEANDILKPLNAGEQRVRVQVLLANPEEAANPDWTDRAALVRVHEAVKQRQDRLLARLPAGEYKVRHRFENFAGFSAEITRGVLERLLNDPDVVSIEPVREVRVHLAQGIPLINGMVYRSTYNGAGVAAAVVDSGVDYTHPRLGGGGFPNSKVLGGYNIGDNNADPKPNGVAHGTSCAGILAGDLGTVGDYIGGVAPAAKLYALKVSVGNDSSHIPDDNIARAWDWCVTHRNDNPNYPILIISTSLGDGRYYNLCDGSIPILSTSANNAVAAGITLLVSAGNDGYCDSICEPACLSGVIAVGAVYDSNFGTYLPCISSDSCAPTKAHDTHSCPDTGGYYATDQTAADRLTSYSSTSANVGVLAPANQCYTTSIVGSGNDTSGNYTTDFGGTSAACPYAAGAVACLQSAAKTMLGRYLTPAEVRTKLTGTGDAITDAKAGITIPRVNLGRAIKSPLVTTRAANEIASTSATLNGTVNPNGLPTTAWFEWGTTTTYGNNTATTSLGNGSAALPVSAPLSGLTPGMTYHYRGVANNTTGTSYGGDQSFVTLRFVGAGALATARSGHTATLLPNGKVLVVGGWGSSGILSSAELYDPATGMWTATGPLTTPRDTHTATLLSNGKVLIAGGYGGQNSAELYDPLTGMWTATGSLRTPRDTHTATLLSNGKVLIAGGYGYSGGGGYLSSAEVYDPATGTWTATGALSTARELHTATLLPNGKVLVAGGAYHDGANWIFLSSAELYDPATGTWTPTGALISARWQYTATLLPNGKLLVAAGWTHSRWDSAELYDPATGMWTATGALSDGRYRHTATLLPNG